MSPSLKVFKNNQLIDELHRRMANGTIQVDLIRSGDGFSQVKLVTVDGYGFEAMAYAPKVAHI